MAHIQDNAVFRI